MSTRPIGRAWKKPRRRETYRKLSKSSRLKMKTMRKGTRRQKRWRNLDSKEQLKSKDRKKSGNEKEKLLKGSDWLR